METFSRFDTFHYILSFICSCLDSHCCFLKEIFFLLAKRISARVKISLCDFHIPIFHKQYIMDWIKIYTALTKPPFGYCYLYVKYQCCNANRGWTYNHWAFWKLHASSTSGIPKYWIYLCIYFFICSYKEILELNSISFKVTMSYLIFIFYTL